jgi:rod shape-determining protein MreC
MRKSSKSYFFLFAALLLVMSLPLVTSEWLRGKTAGLFSPLWEAVSPLHLAKQRKSEDLFPTNLQKNEKPSIKKPSAEAIPARVIFRAPSSWNSSLWINVGSESNARLKHPIVEKNSPVLVGDSVVGVVDYVGKRQSRVRLITDSGLSPSVRVARGQEQNKVFAENVIDLMAYLNTHPEFFESAQDKIVLENALQKLRQKLFEKKHTGYLAKGEISGQSRPLWRTDAHILRGTGFNYDFEDEYGPARDLRSGEPLGDKAEIKATPLVKIHDLLVTTGMDGVFPAGLKVGIVTKIDVLREGDFAFELEAKPCTGHLDDLTWVYVIAPMGYDEKDQPPLR